MDNILGQLIYKITGDSSALDANLDVSRAKIDKTGKAIEDLGTRIKRVSATIISGVLIKSMVDASSRAAELQNKFDTVFSGVEGETSAWVRQYADATNRGVIATKEFLSTQQDLRTGYGDTTESAARFSEAVVGITNDLASFSNVRIEDAMAAVQSGLSYQFEALRRLGVSLSTVTISQGAYAKSIGKTWDEMSNLEKQEAILSGIVSQSKNALHQDIQLWQDYDYSLGDAAKTSDSFANSSQGAKQRLDDMKAELGDSLIPTMTTLTNAGIDLMKLFSDLPDPIQASTTAAIAFGVAMTAIGGPVGIAVGAIGALAIAVGAAETPHDRLSQATKDLEEATQAYAEQSRKAKEGTDDMTDSERSLLDVQTKLAAAKAEDTLTDLVNTYQEDAKKLTQAKKDYVSAQGNLNAAVVASEGRDKIGERIRELQAKSSSLSGVETAELRNLTSVLEHYGDVEKYLQTRVRGFNDQLNTAQTAVANAESTMTQAVAVVAKAYNSGLIDIGWIKNVDQALYDLIVTAAEGSQKVGGAVSDAAAAATYAATGWQAKLRELQADEAEQTGDYRKSVQVRKSLLDDEKDAAIRKLASDANLIQSGEVVTQLSVSELRKRISANSGAAKELEAIDTYYAGKRQETEKEGTDSILDIEKQAYNQRRDQQRKTADLQEGMKEANDEATANEEEAAGNFAAAYGIRLGILKQERDSKLQSIEVDKREATEQLASDLKVIQSGEDVTKMSDEELAHRIKSVGGGAAALAAMEEYYGAQAVAADAQFERDKTAAAKDSYGKRAQIATKNHQLQQTEATATDSLRKTVLDAADQEAISQAELTKDYKSASMIRVGMLKRERDARLASIDTSERQAIEQLASDNQLVASTEDVTQISSEELERRIEDTQTGEAALAAIHERYGEERVATEKDTGNKIVAADKEASKKQKELLKSVIDDISDFASSAAGSIKDLWSNQTDAIKNTIDAQTQAQLEALGLADETTLETLQDEYEAAVKAGDTKLAQEKANAIEKQKIEDAAEEKKEKLEIEEAKREKKLNIFSATLNMATAIIKALADPGGWEGVALSTAAAVEGALQIAAIQAEPLPTFAVGAEDIPNDMFAVVHQGETILPAPMAESVRNGDAVYGNASANVSINIQNNSGARISTEKNESKNGAEYNIIIGEVIEKQMKEGRYDKVMGSRFGIRRSGTHA